MSIVTVSPFAWWNENPARDAASMQWAGDGDGDGEGEGDVDEGDWGIVTRSHTEVLPAFLKCEQASRSSSSVGVAEGTVIDTAL